MVKHGSWGYVCDDGFSEITAQAACYTLGLNYGTFQQGYSYSSTFLMDDVSCPSNTTNFLYCSHKAWGKENCSTGENVLLTCT